MSGTFHSSLDSLDSRYRRLHLKKIGRRDALNHRALFQNNEVTFIFFNCAFIFLPVKEILKQFISHPCIKDSSKFQQHHHQYMFFLSLVLLYVYKF